MMMNRTQYLGYFYFYKYHLILEAVIQKIKKMMELNIDLL